MQRKRHNGTFRFGKTFFIILYVFVLSLASVIKLISSNLNIMTIKTITVIQYT